MSVNLGKKDLRSIKTEKALDIAMSSLLERHNFKKITVKDICEEAMVSRASFYAHFLDKYDFLKSWLALLKPENISRDEPYERMERILNQCIHRNEKVIKNLVCDADNETLEILFDFILSASNLIIEKSSSGKTDPKFVVLSNFYVGGIINYLLWQIKNKFPSDIPPMNIYLYEIIEKFQEWKD